MELRRSTVAIGRRSSMDWLWRRSLNHYPRSEEHTSELQSHLNLVCRLLLEKKKNKEEHRLSMTVACLTLRISNHLRRMTNVVTYRYPTLTGWYFNGANGTWLRNLITCCHRI